MLKSSHFAQKKNRFLPFFPKVARFVGKCVVKEKCSYKIRLDMEDYARIKNNISIRALETYDVCYYWSLTVYQLLFVKYCEMDNVNEAHKPHLANIVSS